MSAIAQSFIAGGPFMYYVLTAGCMLTVLIGLQFGLARIMNLVPLLWSGLIALLLTGALGSVSGVTQAFSAVAAVDPSMKAALMAAGISEALNVSALALLLAIPLALGIGGAATFTLHRRGDGGRGEERAT